MASNIVGLQIEIGGEQKVVNSMRDLKRLLKEAQFSAMQISEEFGETSAQALKAARDIAVLKDKIKDASEVVELFNPEAKFKVLGNAVQAAAGGMAALQGAMGLFGSESEEVQKSLLKVQSALALSQGLSVIANATEDFARLGGMIKNSTLFIKLNEAANKSAAIAMKMFGVSVETTSVSFKVLKGAIAATGIGLLVIAISEAVQYLQEFTTASEDAAKAQEELNKKIVESSEIATKASIQFLDNQMKLDVARAKAAGETEEAIFKTEQSYRRNKIKVLTDHYNEVKGIDGKAADEAKAEIDKINIEGQIAAFQNQERMRKLSEDNAKKKTEEDIQRALEEQEREKAKWAEIYRIELEAYNEQRRLRKWKGKQDAEDAKLASEIAAEEKIKEEEANKEFWERTATYGSAITAMIDNGVKNSALVAIDANQKKQASDQAYLSSKETLTSMEIDLMFKVSELIGQQTLVGKGFAIAAATMDTYAAANKAMNANYGLFGPHAAVARFVAVASTIATGLINVKRIAAVQVPGAGGGASPNIGAGINVQSPLSPATEIGSSQVRLDQRSINSLGNQALRAYVVETDVTGVQQRVRRIQRQTTFG